MPMSPQTLVARSAAASVVSAAALLTAAPAAVAAPPVRTVLHVDETGLATKSSQRCGFDILLRTQGTIRFTDFYDRSGVMTRSLVTYPSEPDLHVQQRGYRRVHHLQQPGP